MPRGSTKVEVKQESLGAALNGASPDLATIKVGHVCSARKANYGAVKSMQELATATQPLGVATTFVTFKRKPLGNELEALGLDVERIQNLFKVDPLAGMTLARIAKKRNLQILHGHLSTSSILASMAAKMAGIPSVATVHGINSKYPYVACNKLVAVSEGVKRHLMKQGVPADRIVVIYNGLETSRITVGSREEARSKLGILDSDIAFGITARITKAKGIAEAIEATAKVIKTHPKVRLVLFGDGHETEFFRSMTISHGIASRVLFAGYQTDIFSVLPALDAFMLPSHKEAMGIAILEAMACGLPCIGTEVGGIPEVILDGETGLLVPDKDSEALAKSMVTLIENPELRSDFGQAGHSRLESEFSSSAMARKALGLYEELLADRR